MENWTPKYWVENQLECQSFLKDESNIKLIPDLLTLPDEELKDGMFVRYQGMIQDMMNPVFYLDKYEVIDKNTQNARIESGRFKDTLHCLDHEEFLIDSENNINEERRSLYCISIPGLNTWAKKIKVKPNKPMSSNSLAQESSKRSQENGDSIQSNKRMHMDIEEEDIQESSNCPMDETNPNEKKQTESIKSTINMDLNLPIPDTSASACLVTIYQNLDSYLVNEVIEVVGFLSMDPTVHNQSSTESELSDQDFSPPCSLVPRLHAVDVRPLPHSNPLVLPELSALDVVGVRNDLKLLFTQMLMGDDLAADYLICYLLSKVYSRDSGDTVLGKFSLNISCPDLFTICGDYTKLLYNILSLLVCKSHLFELTIKSLNETTMTPKKDYNTNRLLSGLLQLSPSTYLFIDEINLKEGQLNNKGCSNTLALSNVIKNQKMIYDFQFYNGTFPTDIPVLTVSEGQSILPSDCHIKLKIDPSLTSIIRETFTAAEQYLKPELLNKIRVYITLLQNRKFDIPDSLSEIVQQDFVQMRKEDKKVDASDLHTNIVLSRLLALSHGLSELTEDMWKLAVNMEKQRKSRIR